MTLFDEFVAVVGALDRAGVDYVLVGGLAVGVWGAPRATKDIDLLVQPADLERAKQAVHACGYVHSALPMRFSDGMQLHRVSKLESGSLVTVDFILVDSNLRAAWESRVRHDLETGSISVVSRDALIAMKLAAGRPQDQADVLKLTEQDR